jgi:hypothetical protein
VKKVKLSQHEIDEGQRLLDRFAADQIPITAAFWVKPTDEDQWSLCVTTPLSNQNARLEGYRQLAHFLESLGNTWLTISDVKLISESDEAIKDVLALRKRFSGWVPNRINLPNPANISIDEMYLYPLGRIEIPIYGLIFRGEPTGGLHLSFSQHNPNSKLIIEKDGKREEYPAQTGIDWLVAAPEGSELERTETGQIAFAWSLHGNRRHSNANEIWSLAKLGLQGFHFLKKPTV